MNAASARLSVGQQGAASTQEGALLRILLAVLFCALMIPFCVSAQGAGICRHCCEPPECCTPEICILGNGSQKSRDLYKTIQDQLDAAGQLKNWIAFGNALTCFEMVGVGCDPEAAVNAMGAIGPILRATINEEVTLFLANQTDYKSLTPDERKYWESVQKDTLP